MPSLARSLDGRDLSNVPWEASGPNAPIFVESFYEYDDAVFAFAEDGGFFELFPNDNPNSLGYRLVPDLSGRMADVLYNGFCYTEAQAIELLSSPYYQPMPTDPVSKRRKDD